MTPSRPPDTTKAVTFAFSGHIATILDQVAISGRVADSWVNSWS
ncbi:hypothetical protein [Streptomyces dangxiongensis]|nr:hypothetical protein [Streptomyces dangxiongensis]